MYLVFLLNYGQALYVRSQKEAEILTIGRSDHVKRQMWRRFLEFFIRLRKKKQNNLKKRIRFRGKESGPAS